ncbi:hypothetical protein [Ammoniphilus sp. YIM 78166]|uniref:hypothetical protein n=1 Tax=Ammoniphilus sp. YIM 78166 TaxID=1644106 RepID=UPI00106F2C6F|nr:hypothetical protein [Ammoniphilus sp. YIM 78166]
MMEKRGERVRAERSDKRIRVNSSYSQSIHEKLDRLATACGIPKTALQTYLVELCLQNENIINYVQDQHKTQSRFRIIPSKVDGDLQFIFAEKKQSYRK